MKSTYVVCENCGQVNKALIDSEKTPVCGSCKGNLAITEAIVKGSDSSLSKLIEKSPLPVVVDVWAAWCGPCRAFAPTFEAASKNFADRVVFVKLNSEENQKLPSNWGIRGIPTLLVFKNGKEIDRISGALPQPQFCEWLKNAIEKI